MADSQIGVGEFDFAVIAAGEQGVTSRRFESNGANIFLVNL